MAIKKQKKTICTCEKCGKQYVLLKEYYASKIDVRMEDYYHCPYCNEKITIKLSGDEEILGAYKIDE